MPTSVPVWPAQAPELDRTGRQFAVLAFGAAAGPIAQGWMEQAESFGYPVQTRQVAEGDPAGLWWARRQARGARVGWRFAVAGPEADVLAACAVVRELGALEVEFTAHAVASLTKNVVCAHCRTTTSTTVDVGRTTPCPGCGAELLVYHHVSPRLAGYLGFQHDAEGPVG